MFFYNIMVFFYIFVWIWAIEIANPENVTAVANTTIKSEGFDGSIFLSCPRVVKKNNGDPILIVSNLSTGGMASSNSAVDVAIWQTANEIFIALDKQKAGLAVYRMYAE